MIYKARKEQEKELENMIAADRRRPHIRKLLFSDFMEEWLEVIREDRNNPLKPTTFGAYQINVQKVIVPYFRKKQILLHELTTDDINEFYDVQLERVKAIQSQLNIPL